MEKTSLSQVENYIVADTTTALGSGSTYTSDIEYVGGYTHICGLVYSDQSSATDGLSIDQAASEADMTAGYYTRSTYTMVGADVDDNAFSVQLVAPFVRIRYTNGASAQSVFRLLATARIVRGL